MDAFWTIDPLPMSDSMDYWRSASQMALERRHGMFWNEAARRWERHPQCRCNHAIDAPCICIGLQMLNDKGEPVSYPALDALSERARWATEYDEQCRLEDEMDARVTR